MSNGPAKATPTVLDGLPIWICSGSNAAISWVFWLFLYFVYPARFDDKTEKIVQKLERIRIPPCRVIR